MTVVTVSPKYQVVIPKDVREKLKIKPGQKVEAFAIGSRIELVPVEPIERFRGRYPTLPPLEREPAHRDALHLLLQATLRLGRFEAALERKADKPVILDIHKLTSYADCLVIMSGSSRRQVRAIVDQVVKALKANGDIPLGVEGGEIMSMMQIAMMGDLPYTALQDAVFAHPTLAESLNNLFGSFVD